MSISAAVLVREAVGITADEVAEKLLALMRVLRDDMDQNVAEFAPQLRGQHGDVLPRLPGDPDLKRHASGSEDFFQGIGLALRDVAPGLAHPGEHAREGNFQPIFCFNSRMKKALITGITGQDGSYLAELIDRLILPEFASRLDVLLCLLRHSCL